MKGLRGLTLIEVIIVIGIISILSSFLSFNSYRSRNLVSLDTNVSSLINDIKNQQLQGMTGYSLGGIYFEESRYTIFHSLPYQNGDVNNFTISLDTGNRFININLPNNQIIFSSSSGMIENFLDNQNSITLRNDFSNEEKTIHFNKFGVVYEIN